MQFYTLLLLFVFSTLFLVIGYNYKKPVLVIVASIIGITIAVLIIATGISLPMGWMI